MRSWSTYDGYVNNADRGNHTGYRLWVPRVRKVRGRLYSWKNVIRRLLKRTPSEMLKLCTGFDGVAVFRSIWICSEVIDLSRSIGLCF